MKYELKYIALGVLIGFVVGVGWSDYWWVETLNEIDRIYQGGE